jgi:hypothetical protein
MEESKDKLQRRRMAMVFGLGGGVLFYFLGLTLRFSAPDRDFHTLFFGNISHWPKWISTGFAPLDFIEICLGFWLVMHLLMCALNNQSDSLSVKQIARLALGVFLGFGALGAMMGTMMQGWFIGLQLFPLMGIGVFAMIGILLAGCGTMFGVGWLIYLGARKFWRGYLSKTWLGWKLHRFGRYMSAEDTPDSPAGLR